MRILFFALIFWAIGVSASNAHAASWKYTAYPLVKYDANDTLPSSLNAGKTKLFAAFPKGQGTIPFFGVEQIYASDGLKKRVFVKKNVRLSSPTPIGGWQKIARGQVLHLRTGRSITAYYAEGFSNRELLDIDKQLRRSVKTASVFSAIIPCANADELTGAVDAKDSGPSAPGKSTEGRDWSNLGYCIAKKTGGALKDKASDAWDATKGAAVAAYEDPLGAAKVVGNWVWDTGGAAVTGIKNGAVAAKDYGVAVWNDPNKIYNDVSAALDKTQKIAVEFYNQTVTAFKDFQNMPLDVQDAIICEMVGAMVADGLIDVVIAAATGVGTVKLAATIAKYAMKLKTYGSVLAALSRAKNMAPDKAREYVRRIFNGKDDPEKMRREIEPERIMAGAPEFDLGQNVNIPRTDGTVSKGKVTAVLSDGRLMVEFVDEKTGRPASKIISPQSLSTVNRLPEFTSGQPLKIPRSDGTLSDGYVDSILPDGRIKVNFTDPKTGVEYTKALPPDMLKAANANVAVAPAVNSPLYTFRSVKGEDYQSRGGATISVDYNSTNLRRTMAEALTTYDRHNVKPIDPRAQPSPAELQRVSTAWLEYAQKIESKNKNIDEYDAARNAIIKRNNNVGDLGEIAACEAAVCRELSIFGSVSLAELGYTTRVVTGNVTGGGHAWIEFLDPRTNTVIGVLDSNYTKRFYSNPAEYYREVNARPIRYTTVASPRFP